MAGVLRRGLPEWNIYMCLLAAMLLLVGFVLLLFLFMTHYYPEMSDTAWIVAWFVAVVALGVPAVLYTYMVS